ncbi:hypothetical protein AVEN_200382-1 [Araneus ventricosus]|uniref:Uncharacterized protein n=1 Tax=Araneus ventricosus TaxID=182803 RepID=A0A4Y2S653_ARAVE|nr:hypothetical protein AVEN_200382-1 [Araneus ventricosus]
MRGKGRPSPLHNFFHLTSSFHFTKPSAENTLLWWKNLLLNKLARIKIAKLIYFLTENENLIKQQLDATSSTDSDPDFSPSPKPQTDGPRPSKAEVLNLGYAKDQLGVREIKVGNGGHKKI